MEDKKRGCIVTWHKVANYGAFLQAYAMKKVLEKRGYDVFFYDYERKYFLFNAYNFVHQPIKTLLRKILRKHGNANTEFYIEKEQVFEKEISKYFQVAALDDTYTLCLIGSDEIFNIESGFNSFQFSSPVKAEKTISYAASFGETSLRMIMFYKLETVLQNSLSQFNGISVRDENSKYLVETLTDKMAELHIDPVLYYGFEEECSEMQAQKTEPYILFYAYDSHVLKKEYRDAILKFAREKKLKIISCGYYHSWCDENINCSPFDFISYVKYAEYIVTTTFHGSVFSILLNKQFCVIPQNNANKLCYLLKQFSLESQIITQAADIAECLDHKNDRTSIILQERAKADQFLQEYV